MAMLFFFLQGMLFPVLSEAWSPANFNVESNIVVDDGKVLFCQWRGGLTVLDLDSGRIIRKFPHTWLGGKWEEGGAKIEIGEKGYYIFLQKGTFHLDRESLELKQVKGSEVQDLEAPDLRNSRDGAERNQTVNGSSENGPRFRTSFLNGKLTHEIYQAFGRAPDKITNRLHLLSVLEFEQNGAAWRAIHPSLLKSRQRIVAAAESDEEIVIGTSIGTVECIEKKTARTRWIYVFPAYGPSGGGESPVLSGNEPYMSRVDKFKTVRAEADRFKGLISITPSGPIDKKNINWEQFVQKEKKQTVPVRFDPEPFPEFTENVLVCLFTSLVSVLGLLGGRRIDPKQSASGLDSFCLSPRFAGGYSVCERVLDKGYFHPIFSLHDHLSGRACFRIV